MLSVVSAGGEHTCGIKNDLSPEGYPDQGTVECWGRDTEGQATVPEAFNGIPYTFTQITTGGYHTCGLDTASMVRCWGGNPLALEPPDPDEFRFKTISAGGDFTCGVTFGMRDGQTGEVVPGFEDTRTGDIMCWGANDDGQLNAPSERYLQVSAGQSYVSALTYDGTVLCWGFSNPQGNCEPPEDFSAF